VARTARTEGSVSNSLRAVGSASPPLLQRVPVGESASGRSLRLPLGTESSASLRVLSDSGTEADGVLEAARRYAELVSGIVEVKAVVLEPGDGVRRVVTYMSPRDVEARDRVYRAQRAVWAASGLDGVELRVVSMEDSAAVRARVLSGAGVTRLLLRG
jgi:hypothetical protein